MGELLSRPARTDRSLIPQSRDWALTMMALRQEILRRLVSWPPAGSSPKIPLRASLGTTVSRRKDRRPRLAGLSHSSRPSPHGPTEGILVSTPLEHRAD